MQVTFVLNLFRPLESVSIHKADLFGKELVESERAVGGVAVVFEAEFISVAWLFEVGRRCASGTT